MKICRVNDQANFNVGKYAEGGKATTPCAHMFLGHVEVGGQPWALAEPVLGLITMLLVVCVSIICGSYALMCKKAVSTLFFRRFCKYHFLKKEMTRVWNSLVRRKIKDGSDPEVGKYVFVTSL